MDKNLEPASPVASRQEDGGPAFPTFEPVEQFQQEAGRYETIYLSQGGMTMRDWFAGKAVGGLLSDSETSISCEGPEKHWTQAVARMAYTIADAMLKARKAGAA